VSSPRPPGSRGRVPVASSCLRRYGVAVLATAAALLCRLALDAVLEDRAVFLLSTLALLVSAWYGGLGPGFLATGLSASVIGLVLLEPRWTPTLALLADGLSLVIFVVVGLGMSALVAQLHRARQRAEAEAAERTAADEARRAHERFIHQVTELSPVILDVFDLVTGRHTYFSSDTLTVYGYTREEMVQMGDTFTVLVHPDDIPRLRANMARLHRLADGEIHEFECRVQRRDGEWRWIAARSMAFARNEQGDVRQTVNAAFDVTERKRAEEAVQRAHAALEQRVVERTHQLTAANAALLQEIVERTRVEEALRRSEAYLAEGQRLSHTGSWGWTIATGALFWSQEQFRLFGFDPAGSPPSLAMALDLIHPEDRAFVQQTLDAVVREARDEAWDCRIVSADGTIKHVHTTAHPVFNAAGELTEYVGTTMDVTARRQAEAALQEAQAALVHATRIMILGELTAAIAHELNQPLGAIVTNGRACLRWLAREGSDLEEARAAVDRIIRDGHRAGDVIRRIRALAQHTAPQQTWLDLNDVIHEAVVLVRSEIDQHRVTLRMELSAMLPPVWVDRVQVQQVLLNLIMNGIEAMSSVTDRPRELRIESQPHDSDTVLVAVRDAGIGLDPRTSDQLFDPFVTTKPEGMGLGLSICRTIIGAHGGRLWATAHDGPGATVCFTLPTGTAQA